MIADSDTRTIERGSLWDGGDTVGTSSRRLKIGATGREKPWFIDGRGDDR